MIAEALPRYTLKLTEMMHPDPPPPKKKTQNKTKQKEEEEDDGEEASASTNASICLHKIMGLLCNYNFIT